jgi:DEAD/DEAH box helicase domain-containing protein
MSFLVCFDCRNQLAFLQVSEQSDAREIEYANLDYRVGVWGGHDPRSAGIYCAHCGGTVQSDDLRALKLHDDRVPFMPYDAFRAEALAEEFAEQVPDAEWTRFEIPATAPRYLDATAPLTPPVRAALERTGRRLYLHQALTIDSALSGRDVVVTTAAGSGKSLGYQVPVLDVLHRNPVATALLVFPMRALAADQMKALSRFSVDDVDPSSAVMRIRLADDSDPVTVVRHDGGTLDGDRRTARAEARIVLTTPDSLHRAILGNCRRRYRDGTAWDRFLGGLRMVVLDEVHMYRGVFGSVVAQILRRLRRAADAEGARIRWLASSATIGNPAEHVARLTGVADFVAIGPDQDGAGRAARVVALCNPPHLSDVSRKQRDHDATEQRQAPTTVGLELMAHALANPERLPVRTICFARSRNEVHAFTKRLSGRIEAEYHRRDVAAAVGSYTATLLSDDRGEQENRLKDGRLLGIVSTNALELGIDIPDLSLALLIGYPGQLSSFRQRAGRVGRQGEGLAVLVVGDDPLQQHLVRSPDYLLSAAPEHAVIALDSAEIVERYGLHPAQEEAAWGLSAADEVYFGPAVRDWIRRAHEAGAAPTVRANRTHWKVPLDGDAYADIRSPGGAGSYSVVERRGRENRAVGTVDSGSGPRDCFLDAVWTGADEETFVVTNVDHRAREVHVERRKTDYLTRGLVADVLDVVEQQRADRHATFDLGAGRLSIRRVVHSYKKVYLAGSREESVGGAGGWAPRTFTTSGLWLDVAGALGQVGPAQREAALVSVEHLLLALLPALVAADPVDFESHAAVALDRIYLYDSSALGIGLAMGAYGRIDALLRLAHDVASACDCADGCPGCVYLARRPDGNAVASRSAALGLLNALVGTAA